MSNTFSFEEASQPVTAPAAGGDQAPKAFSFEEASGKPAPKGFMGHARDLGLSALQGAIGVPEAAAGLADIPTGGAVGKALENEGGAFGFRPKQAREYLDTLKTDGTQQQKREFEQADGVIGKTAYALQNPSLVANAVAESLPMMGAGGVIGRGLVAAAPRMSAGMAAAAGEGITAAGSAAEQIRQETADGNLTPAQAGLAAATGVTTAGFGALGAKVAGRLGIADADTLMVQGAKGLTGEAAQQAAMKSIPRKVIEGAISEGFLEELPQSASEQILQNMALSKDWSEGVDSAVVLGALSGMAMGGGAAGLQGAMQSPRQEPAPGQPPADVATQGEVAKPLALPAPTYTGTPEEQLRQAEAARAGDVAAADARAAELYQQRADFEASKQPARPGLEMMRQAYAEQLQALQGQEAGEPDVPQSAPPDGRAILDAQAAQAQAERDAAIAASRATQSPDDEILQSIGATAEPPHRAMGIDPAAGPLSAGAAIAVDTGVAGQMQAAAQAAQGQLAPDAGPLQAASAGAGPKQATGNSPATDAVQSTVSNAVTRAMQAGLPTAEGKAAVEQAAQKQITLSTPDLVRQFAEAAAKDGAILRRVGKGTPKQIETAMTFAVPVNTPQYDRLMRNEGFVSGMKQALREAAAQPAARWDSMLGPEREALANTLGLPPVIARNLPRAGWATLNPDLQTRIAKAMAPAAPAAAPEISEGKQAGASPAEASNKIKSKNLVQLVRESGGVSLDRKADIDQDSRTVGVFRKGGMDLDGLAELMQQHGFMTEADVTDTTSGAERAAELLRAALAGERVLSMNDADAVMGQDAEAQYRDEIRRKAAEYGVRTTFRPFGDIERDVLARDGELAPEDRSDYEYSEAIAYALEPLDDIDPQDARELSEAEQMRALGFTEDEINEAIDGTSARSGQGSPEQAQPGAAQEGRGAGAQEDPGQEVGPEGLTSYTNEEIARREADQRAAAAEAERTQREADQKARADAERDTFTLTGSDRAADVMAAQGQGGLFDAPAETKPTNLKEGLAKIRKEKAAQATEANQEPIKSETRANAGFATESAPADQEATKTAEFASDGNGLSQAAKRLRESSKGKPSSDTDVGLNTVGGVKYVSFVDAVAATRRAIESGIRPVPFQIHDALDILIGDAQRVIDAAVGGASAVESQSQPKNEAARPAATTPAVGNAPSPLEALFSDLNSGSTRKANKAKKAAAKLPQAARIDYVQANFHDILIQMMEAGALEVNGATTLTEDNAPCL